MADLGLGNIQGVLTSYLSSGMFWFVISILLIILIGFFYGYFSRRSKLKYNCLELVRYGNGKVGINLTKAGIFKSKLFLGMFDYGRESLYKTSDNKIIQQGKTSQLHDIFGKKGFIVMRSPKDAKLLLPISKVDFDNLKAIFDIAPADFRESSVRIFREAVEETKGTWEKLLPYIAIGLCVIMTIINVVVNMQMTNHTTDKVGNMLIAGCQNTVNTKPSTSP
jgi:hypothetical protein